MAVIFSRTIRERELRKGVSGDIDAGIVVKAFQKGIFTRIKGKDLPKNSQLMKVYATTIEGARRIVYMLDTKSGDGFLLFYRNKNDQIGRNITLQNPEFKVALHKYLLILMNDIESGNIDIFN